MPNGRLIGFTEQTNILVVTHESHRHHGHMVAERLSADISNYIMPSKEWESDHHLTVHLARMSRNGGRPECVFVVNDHKSLLEKNELSNEYHYVFYLNIADPYPSDSVKLERKFYMELSKRWNNLFIINFEPKEDNPRWASRRMMDVVLHTRCPEYPGQSFTSLQLMNLNNPDVMKFGAVNG